MAERLTEETVNLYQPKKRFLIPITNFHVPRKLYKLFKQNKYTFRLNHNFEKVILNDHTNYFFYDSICKKISK